MKHSYSSVAQLETVEPKPVPGGQPTHPAVIEVFRELDHEQAVWALLRAPLDPRRPDGGDIDLLVHPSDLLKVECLFRRLGFIRLPGSATHFLRYDAPSDQWLWFHVVDELSFGRGRRFETGAGTACLDRRRADGNPPHLEADDAFWALLLHCVLDKREIAPRHRRSLQELALGAGGTGPLSAWVAGVGGSARLAPSWIVELARGGDWEAVEHALSVFDAGSDAQRHSGVGSRIVHRVWRAARAYAKPRPHPGVSVALLGPDGAGKSTLAQGLAASFRVPVRVMYMGLTGGALKHVARVRLPGVVFVGRAIVIWQRYLKARFHQAHGRIVVFDRYTLDAAVPHPKRLNRLQRLSRYLDRYLCPLPDLVLILDAPGTVMHRRKGEYSPEILEDWRRHFLALRARVHQVEVIDATRDEEAVRIEATERIWRRYHARCSSS